MYCLVFGSVWFLEFSVVGLEMNFYVECYGWSLFHNYILHYVISMCAVYYRGI